MFRFSQLYNSKVEIYKAEKRKTEKLLGSLLPTSVIQKLKKGQMPKPQVFDSASIFFCDIVSFTSISSSPSQPPFPGHRVFDRSLLCQILGNTGACQPELVLKAEVNVVVLKAAALQHLLGLGRHD